MYYVEITLLLAGFVLLLVGYRKNSRDILAGSAIVLLLAGAFPDFVAAFRTVRDMPFLSSFLIVSGGMAVIQVFR